MLKSIDGRIALLGPPSSHVHARPRHLSPARCGRYLDGPEVWVCSECKTHLSTNDQIVSKQFTGRGGRAFLFDKVCVANWEVDLGLNTLNALRRSDCSAYPASHAPTK